MKQIAHIQRLLKREYGATTVEFAISFIVFITALFAVLEFGRIYWLRSALQEATFVAGRYVLLNPSAADSQIRSQVTSNAFGLTPASITTTISTQTISGVTYKTISASYPIPMMTFIMPNSSYTLRGTTKVPILP